MFRSGELPAGERLAAADELFGRSVLPMRLVSQADGVFEATVRHVDLASMKVVELAATPAAMLRTPRLIRRADPEVLSVILSLNGGLVVSQSGRETEVGRDQLALYDSSLPFRIGVATGDGTTTVVSAHVPRAQMELPLAGLGRLLARPLPAGRGSGFGGLLTQLLTDVTGEPGDHRPVDLVRMGSIAHDLLTAVVAHHLDAETAVPDDARHRALLLRIDSFVRKQLHDPTLSPATIAAAHHISVGHLHRLFGPRGTTVAAWIRRQRLERARRDLADPALRELPVHRIATRWGFTGHSTFTRAFRAAYGTAPQDYRHQAAAAPGHE
ncbi:helix-turn-helix domain-containing protein [Actinacidiphila acididurans]|nr:helix-turn-helix domain-containing protein [Actinacidiphila acididurans]